MIPLGHRHVLYPVSATPRDNGTLVVHSRCNADPPTPQNPDQRCLLEEERVFRGETPVSVRYRLAGVWFSPLDLLRLLPLDLEQCPDCEGERMLMPCERCGGLGVTEDGGMLTLPNLHVRA